MTNKLTGEEIVAAVFNNEINEVLTNFPEYRKIFEPYETAYDFLEPTINMWHYTLDDENLTEKEFERKVDNLHFKDVLSLMRQGYTIEGSFDKIPLNDKVKLLEYYIN